MRRLLNLFLLFAALLNSLVVYAEDRMCGMGVSNNSARKAEVVCSSCSTYENYALAGAAAAKSRGLGEIRVSSPNGKTKVHVTLSTAYGPSSATFGGGVGVTGHMTHGLPDETATKVTAFAVKGSASGSSFGGEIVPNSTLSASCDELVDQWNDAVAQNIRNTESVNRIEGESIEKYLHRAWLNGVKITNGGGGRTGRSWSCQADDEGKCKTQGVPKYYY